MTLMQQILTIAICALGTVLTRFLPFFVFREGKETPPLVSYLGAALPSAIFAMLVVYSLRSVDVLTGSHGLPEAIAILITVGLHLWKRQMLLSIAGGTLCYMVLVQVVF